MPVLLVHGSSTVHAEAVNWFANGDHRPFFLLRFIKRLLSLSFLLFLVLPSFEWPRVLFNTDRLLLNAYHVQFPATMALHRLSTPYI